MPGRVDTLTYAGAGLIGAGTTGKLAKDAAEEAAKNALECLVITPKEEVINLMDLNLLFGYLPGYEVNLSGLLAVFGAVMIYVSYRRGSKQKKEREEKERTRHPLARDPKE